MSYQTHEIPSEYQHKWQRLVDIMAKIFDVPAGLIMRVQPAQIEVLISSNSAGNPYRPREKADLNTGLYCETVMKTRSLLAVPNALLDEEWKSNPDVELNMISYLGIPLVWPDSEVFGTICVLDNKTRQFSKTYENLLWEFKQSIETDFEIIEQKNALSVANKMLEKEIIERKKVEKQLRVSLQEKETLLREIHHRVNNSISMVANLLMLQMDSTTSDEAKTALQESQSRIHSIALIHESLYRSDNFTSIEMQTYLSRLVKIIGEGLNIGGRIKLTVHCGNIFLAARQATPVGLITNELLTNALKYAFPGTREGEIVLELKTNEKKELQLVVSDNGIGIPENFNWREGDSLGLKLVKLIAENQLNGSIDLTSREGTTFTVTLKDEPRP